MKLQSLNDRDLIRETERIARTEREFTIQLLHHLNEIARRRLHLDLGYQSLHDYCIRGLRYSSSAAGRRIAAARCIRRFPQVLALLESAELSLCTVAMIESILDEDNIAGILPRVQGASRRDVEKVVCEFRPPVHLRDRIRPVRVALNEPIDVDRLMFEREIADGVPPEWRTRAVRIADRLHVEFLADEALVAKFEQAKALICGRNSDMSFADVFDVIVTEFLRRRSPAARHERREAKKADREVRTPTGGSEKHVSVAGAEREQVLHTPTGGSEEHVSIAGAEKEQILHTPTGGSERARTRPHIPAAVRDEVFVRDGGRCSFVGAGGTRCESRKGLEVDHIVPLSAGGSDELSNLRLLCPAHNLRAAENVLGAHVMAPFWQRE